ncbi:threonine aldolase family protein [Moheibacter lacus]|uniref:Aminotransferase class V-fold PLP-dependent enzyme n=1 Tax=Moheibacter lacus TaxID=2745851 RepID=A0A838ZP13_9FLAO|nr:aminotransferase class I/II-fold pyridoxal phosphate-dependent enzyme [Moheibacter lacus]MBA5629760.1 aminotransferase class V-fold PLP-dependent enzyme [Moheibacter lacus]
MNFSFKNDYAEGCHPNILKALVQFNFDQQNGYGLDEYSQLAEQIIQEKIKSETSKVHFVAGGTQANLIVISAFLRPHESVVSASTGHIFTNEAGAIEATGHKVHSVEKADGKLNPEDIQSILDGHQNIPHQLKPKLVYISNSTEIGTIYTQQELEDLSKFCKENELYLFMDGARLPQALMAFGNDLNLEEIAKLTDAFYLGGTKNGALLGEAIVINNQSLQPEFGFHIKQKGAMLAKGRLLGIQFLELMRGDLYLQLAAYANAKAMLLKSAFTEIGCEFLTDTFTNQIFPIVSIEQAENLAEHFDFYQWKKLENDKVAIRIITSWATNEEAVEQFATKIRALKS